MRLIVLRIKLSVYNAGLQSRGSLQRDRKNNRSFAGMVSVQGGREKRRLARNFFWERCRGAPMCAPRAAAQVCFYGMMVGPDADGSHRFLSPIEGELV